MLTTRYTDALTYAVQIHDGQLRKGTQTPYIAHPLAVSSLVLEHGGDEDCAIAALLHDAIEDQGVKTEDIRRMFGNHVADIVMGCTNQGTLSGKTSLSSTEHRERKMAYLKQIKEAPPNIKLVATADKLHNARSCLTDYRQCGEMLWNRFSAGKEDVLWYYRKLSTILGHSKTPLVEELKRTVDELCRISQKPS